VRSKGFEAHFTAATTIEGSEWAVLGRDTLGERLLLYGTTG
jgi:superoxide dismutase, Fe-Mn family